MVQNFIEKELVESYFSRLIKSIKLLTDDLKMDFPETIYVNAFGLDDLDYHIETTLSICKIFRNK